MTSGVHINFTCYQRIDLHRMHCPTCKRKRFFVSFFQDWYGWDSTCLKCGECWQDGHMLERPFERGWRTRRIKQAKATYRRWKKILQEQPDDNR